MIRTLHGDLRFLRFTRKWGLDDLFDRSRQQNPKFGLMDSFPCGCLRENPFETRRKALNFERDTSMYNPRPWAKLVVSRAGCGAASRDRLIILGSGALHYRRDFANPPNNNLGNPRLSCLATQADAKFYKE